MKTFRIEKLYGPTGRMIECWLTRYGKCHAVAHVQGLDGVTPIWRLRQRAEELGATHVVLTWTGCRENV